MATVQVTPEWVEQFKEKWSETLTQYLASASDAKLRSTTRQEIMQGRLAVILEALLKDVEAMEGPVPQPPAPKPKKKKTEPKPTKEAVAELKKLKRTVQEKEEERDRLIAELRQLETDVPKEVLQLAETSLERIQASESPISKERGKRSLLPSEEQLMDIHNGYMNLFAGKTLIAPPNAHDISDMRLTDVAELKSEVVSNRKKVDDCHITYRRYAPELPALSDSDEDSGGPARTRNKLASRFRAAPYHKGKR